MFSASVRGIAQSSNMATKEVDDDIIQQVMPLKVEAEGGDGPPRIQMKLCGDPIEIKFADKHLIDLQEMIKTSQESGV